PGVSPILDFSVSLNPLGPPVSVLQAIGRHVPAIAHYPDPHCRGLVERLARLHGVAPERGVVGNGSSELIHTLPRALGSRRVAIVEPTYTEYLRASLAAGADVVHWLPEEETFQPEPFAAGGADLVWLCHPNNPTGQLWDTPRLAAWIAHNPRTYFVVD